MDRNYQKVEMGVGAFHHPPRAKYSEETKNLIKLLMEESKVSMMRRKSIQDAINRGESLPPLLEKSKIQSNKSKYQVLMPTEWKRRSQDRIIQSGAYEREQFRRTSPLRNKEKQKRHLACMMAYGKNMPETPRRPSIFPRARREPRTSKTIDDPIDDLVRGIQERMEFLSDMESLGMGKKYRPIIEQEVAHNLRLIESVDKQKSKEVRKDIGVFTKPSLKPFPPGQVKV